MKIKENIDLDILLKYGFKKKATKEQLPSNNFDWNSCELKENIIIDDREFEEKHEIFDDDQDLYWYDDIWVYNCGESRRSQFYYIIIFITSREVHILATKAEGEGGSIKLPELLIKMIKDEIIIS